ncbi:Good for full DBP5 activity 2 [Hyphodiscus hymeniophilus]|uniref:Good for full DBP5 activity 2 n=1 Tax=Hyphodiscus hymeniophilus TaxID=353542 RepID=A0A9P6VFC2_9HELO|nr:Good for full DBP5 activity 2 [Hyphodiscus hymeniophilus]
MDKLSKLQALLPEIQVSATEAGSPWAHPPKPAHLYEGTDSDDDEEIMRQGRISQHQIGQSSETFNAEGTGEVSNEPSQPRTERNVDLEMGQLAIGGDAFCPWQAIKKYPYTYIGSANRDSVVEGFWKDGKICDQTWDFFYIHRLASDASQTPMLLVPTKQVKDLLTTINQSLDIHLTIPSGSSGFEVTFEDDGTPQPRYLGRSTDSKMASNLHAAVPPHWFKPKSETTNKTSTPTDRSIAAFKAKMALMAQAQKGKKVINSEKRNIDRIAKQQSWNQSIKRVQRYLGLRQASDEKQKDIARARVQASESVLQWGEHSAAVKTVISRPAVFKPDQPAAYDQESDVVFICVDIEANERNSTQITEIGISTLDTRDLKGLVPGERGVNWFSKIRARHFRINEYKYIRNTDFVSGCPDKFEFGDSEFVGLKDAPRAVASCFKHPFSAPEDLIISIDENAPKRNIIFVGHGIGADITYLKSMGYDVYNLSNLQEIVDTAVMWQSLKRDTSPRNLGSILAEIDIAGWNLHNAGNDAVYTLQAMVGISIRHLNEQQKRQEEKDQERKARVEEQVCPHSAWTVY